MLLLGVWYFVTVTDNVVQYEDAVRHCYCNSSLCEIDIFTCVICH